VGGHENNPSAPVARLQLGGRRVAGERRLGFGRIVAAEIEVPNMSVNLVKSG
jgi:hypothetical protein